MSTHLAAALFAFVVVYGLWLILCNLHRVFAWFRRGRRHKINGTMIIDRTRKLDIDGFIEQALRGETEEV